MHKEQVTYCARNFLFYFKSYIFNSKWICRTFLDNRFNKFNYRSKSHFYKCVQHRTTLSLIYLRQYIYKCDKNMPSQNIFCWVSFRRPLKVSEWLLNANSLSPLNFSGRIKKACYFHKLQVKQRLIKNLWICRMFRSFIQRMCELHTWKDCNCRPMD